MTNVIQFDPTRVKRAAHIAEGSGEIVQINPSDLMVEWCEEFEQVAVEAANTLTQRPDVKIADAVESSVYRVLNARYRHVNAGDRKDALIASGVESYMINVGSGARCIYSAVMELLDTRAMLKDL